MKHRVGLLSCIRTTANLDAPVVPLQKEVGHRVDPVSHLLLAPANKCGFHVFCGGGLITPFQGKHQMRDQVSMHVSRVINLITNFIHVHLVFQVRFQVTELAKFDKDDRIIILISLACFSLYRWKRCAISVTCFFCSPSEASQEVGFNFARLYDECPS